MTTNAQPAAHRRGPDRRHPLITTDVLRRDLRQADDELFTARASLAASRPRFRLWKRAGLFGALILTAGAVTAVWAARNPAPVPQAGEVRVQVSTVGQPPIFHTVEPIVNDARSVSVPARFRSRALRHAGVKSVRNESAKPRSRVPRPLSPGEFGRAAGTRAN